MSCIYTAPKPTDMYFSTKVCNKSHSYSAILSLVVPSESNYTAGIPVVLCTLDAVYTYAWCHTQDVKKLCNAHLLDV